MKIHKQLLNGPQITNFNEHNGNKFQQEIDWKRSGKVCVLKPSQQCIHKYHGYMHEKLNLFVDCIIFFCTVKPHHIFRAENSLVQKFSLSEHFWNYVQCSYCKRINGFGSLWPFYCSKNKRAFKACNSEQYNQIAQNLLQWNRKCVYRQAYEIVQQVIEIK